MEELKPCPFCEGEIRDKEYERDPYSGLRYAVAHDDPNGACPIATYDEPLTWLYDSRDGVAHAWNRRAERTCRNLLSGQYDGETFKCSECGYACEVAIPEEPEHYSWLADWHCELPAYCPNCGAKVVER